MGRHGCYGRMWYDEIQSTVVGRAEPHNLRLVHPEQDRVVTIRENARCQVRKSVSASGLSKYSLQAPNTRLAKYYPQ